MARLLSVTASLLLLSTSALGASEKLLEDCRYWRLAKDGVETAARLAACDRIIADKGAAPADRAEAYAARANRASSDDRKADAIADFDQALALSPDQTGWRRDRAILLHFTDDHDRAIEDFDRVLAEKPDGHMMFYRGLSYLEKGDEAHGFADLDRGIALAPNDYWYPYWRGMELAKRGRDAEALDSVDKSIAAKGDEVNPYILRSELSQKKGDTKAAIADLTRALELDPSYKSPRSNRALLYQQTGQYELALADYDKLLTLEPGDTYYTQRKADVMAKLSAEPGPQPKTTEPAREAKPEPPVQAKQSPPEAKKTEPVVEAKEPDCRYYLAVTNTTIAVPCPD